MKSEFSLTYIGSHSIIVTSTCKGTAQFCDLASGLVNRDNITTLYTH